VGPLKKQFRISVALARPQELRAESPQKKVVAGMEGILSGTNDREQTSAEGRCAAITYVHTDRSTFLQTTAMTSFRPRLFWNFSGYRRLNAEGTTNEAKTLRSRINF